MIPGSRSGFSCAKGTFCNSSRKCVAKIKAGKNCSVDDGELCEDGCTCNAGFCVKRFSVNDGEKCTVKQKTFTYKTTEYSQKIIHAHTHKQVHYNIEFIAYYHSFTYQLSFFF